MSDRYRVKYKPDHPRADKNGYVLEHIIVAEQKIGRTLLPGEVVHHIDHNKRNNSPDNLMVFENCGQHTMYHWGGRATQKEDGTWICEMEKHFATCKHCGKRFELTYEVYAKKRNNQYCSKDCFRKDSYKAKVELEEIVKTLRETKGNFTATGRKYGITANAIVKRLKSQGLPYHSADYLLF